jgi:hypothetical protein
MTVEGNLLRSTSESVTFLFAALARLLGLRRALCFIVVGSDHAELLTSNTYPSFEQLLSFGLLTSQRGFTRLLLELSFSQMSLSYDYDEFVSTRKLDTCGVRKPESLYLVLNPLMGNDLDEQTFVRTLEHAMEILIQTPKRAIQIWKP